MCYRQLNQHILILKILKPGIKPSNSATLLQIVLLFALTGAILQFFSRADTTSLVAGIYLFIRIFQQLHYFKIRVEIIKSYILGKKINPH